MTRKDGALTSNTVDGAGARGVTDLVAVGGELPEALRVVDVGVGEGTSVLGVVDVAKVVGAGSRMLQGDGEQRGVQAALDSVKPGGLRLGLD